MDRDKKSKFLIIWLKAAFLVSFGPFMVFVILGIHDRIELKHSLYGMGCTYILSALFVRKYLADIMSLSYYIAKLSDNDKLPLPPLKFLSHIQMLPQAVAQLAHSWEHKKQRLESIIIENRILLNSLPDILLMIDNTGQIVQSNYYAHKVFGYHLEGKLLREIIDQDLLDNFIKWSLHDKEDKQFELYLSDTNKFYMVRLIAFPQYSSNRIAIIMIMTDITENKRTEKMFSDFISNASHEIRTPLMCINGIVETL